MDESFGPEYVRPAQADCSRCGCCTAALCEKGRNSVRRCAGSTTDEHRTTVDGCPCSAETTQRTAAWRPVEDPNSLFPQLKLRGLGQLVHALPAITPLGHTYLAALDDARAPASVRVVDVDMKSRTAQVEVTAWRTDELATVLVDLIASDTGLNIDALPGSWLVAEANCHADSHDRLVLTGFRKQVSPPAGWMGTGGGGGE
ncbi:hypothetical protein [Streptomyces sp. ITFR-6]|uniref:hypothetical protein n=1 Tax=Streptomyces sp. ITFR-6 TaxID=3075197 RepID=UPI00288BD56A|nr:hypothetical protein [Streptomyces sp. ITFR-6]WNI31456.1 hypothetical protein RLT59_23700 [Streptomyces sp. ITFR-6]